MTGRLVAFEGLDQSGKETQARLLGGRLEAAGRRVRPFSFPDYATPIGAELGRALHGERDYGADVMQLLYIANRYEWKPEIERALSAGDIVLCDRYLASSVAYGEAFGLDPSWLLEVQRFLPRPSVTVLLEIDPETAVDRKARNRDRFERDLTLLRRVRESYERQAGEQGWIRVDGRRPKPAVAADVWARVWPQLAPR
jgi:dTMP kinase